MKKLLCEMMKKEVRETLESMRSECTSMSYDEVVALQWTEKEPIKINGSKYFPAIWSQTFPDSEALLVVQLTRWYFLKLFGSTDCIGFTLKKNGELHEVDEYWLMHEVGHP